MKALQLLNYGQALVVEEAAKPVPTADEVLVEVSAVSVNPFDYKLAGGVYEQYIPLSLPATLGGDVSGVVVEVGQDAKGFEVGQEVYGLANAAGGQGSFAEFVSVNAEKLSAKPSSIDFSIAAALPLAAVSAYQALADHINLQPGQKILIHGGSGGIGSLAIQIAKDLGAYIATTVSSDNIDYVKSLGADEVIDYKTQKFEEVIKDFDAVFDTVGGDTLAKSYSVLKKGGILVSMGQVNADTAKQLSINAFGQMTVTDTTHLNRLTELV